MIKNSGVILFENRKEYTFQASQISGKIPELNDYPAVIVELKNDEVVSLKFDPETPRLREAPRSGHKMLGAAKCPNCTWRIPILPSKGMGIFRNGQVFRCPECSKTIRLKSMFTGLHNYLAVSIWVIPATARWFLGRLNGIVDEQTMGMIGIISLVFYPIQLLAFFYLYIQEHLVLADDVETFE
ncbi:hypothetical protein N9W89_12375 [Hellea sp.]|nr:hypothetical protein [Hellea sp.]